MLLSDLLSSINTAQIDAFPDVVIKGLAYDSRNLNRGDLFFAVPGEHVDGSQFIGPAIERGAIAVIGHALPGKELSVPFICVPDVRATMARVAAQFYDFPAKKLITVGVTGTDGKTTTSSLLQSMLQGTGHKAGLMSTVSFRIGDDEWDNNSRQTTLESVDIQRLLSEMVQKNVTHAVVETSSHALVLNRVDYCYFDQGVFTNLTSDHLDFHHSIDEYRLAKSKLFRMLGSSAKPGSRSGAIINADDPNALFMAEASSAPVLTYGCGEEATVRASHVKVTANSIQFDVTTPTETAHVESPMTGHFNVSNLLAVLAYAYSQHIPLTHAVAILNLLEGVNGRMKRIDEGQDFTVIVDYAHTPDSLGKVLDDLRTTTRGKLIVVFGAAGERDTSKRPIMGRIAAQKADISIVTNEDPRFESPDSIVEQIVEGSRLAGALDDVNLFAIVNRTEAIDKAISFARPGDTVLLAGKGHEQCIIVGAEKRPWSEENSARLSLRKSLSVRG